MTEKTNIPPREDIEKRYADVSRATVEWEKRIAETVAEINLCVENYLLGRSLDVRSVIYPSKSNQERVYAAKRFGDAGYNTVAVGYGELEVSWR